MKAALIAVLALWCLPSPGRADPAEPGVAEDVVSVVSIDNAEHEFRVVVTSGGIEHVVSRMFFQWLTTDADTGGQRIVTSTRIREIEFHSLGVPTIQHKGKGFEVSVEGVNSHLDPAEKARFSFFADAPGSYRRAD